jgi:hypothetical protein
MTSYIVSPIEDFSFCSIHFFEQKKQYLYIKDDSHSSPILMYDDPEGCQRVYFTDEIRKYFKKVHDCSHDIYIDKCALDIEDTDVKPNSYILEYLFDLPLCNKILLYSKSRKVCLSVSKKQYLKLDEFLISANKDIASSVLKCLGTNYIDILQNYKLNNIKVDNKVIEMV